MADSGFFRDASNRLTFEMPNVPACDYSKICRELIRAFGLVQTNEMTTGTTGLTDVAFQSYQLGEQGVSLEWDNWVGFTIVAKNQAAEHFVREMGAYLQKSKWSDANPS